MSKQNMSQKNKLYFGDNLDILKDKIPNDSVDLIYLDPPFQSDKNYNQIFKPTQGEIKGATAQIQAFRDTWKWGTEAEKNYEGLITNTITKQKPNQKLIDLMKAMRGYLGESSMMAYLAMMAPRLLEMQRVLKPTGSIYLHCDPTASHYLKLLMDAVFESKKFRNEIVWCYSAGNPPKRNFPRKHDIIFRYTKSDKWTFNTNDKILRVPFNKTALKMHFKEDKNGRLYRKYDSGKISYADEGKLIPDYWTDIDSQKATSPISKEYTGYPTQKPEALLERIIKASSNKGDIILDPFCGCGTAVAVAQKLGRKWIGIDITYLAIDVIAKRLEKSGFQKDVIFEIDGEPKDVYSAEKLAQQDRFQFQFWCIAQLNATPSQKKSGDEGVDGIVNFIDFSKKDKAGKGIISVKSNKVVNPEMVRELKGTIKSQNADFGILITLKQATQGMISEAVKEGHYKISYTPDTTQKEIPKIQLISVEDLFKSPIPIILPPSMLSPFAKPIINQQTGKQSDLLTKICQTKQN